jgi:hypothetical protein
MRTTTRLPIAIPTLRGKPILCGVEAMVDIAEYDAVDAPTACTFEERYARRPGGTPRATAFRFADGRFLKMCGLGRFGEPDSTAAAITGFAVDDIVGRSLSNVRRNRDPDMLAAAYMEAESTPHGYETLYAAVMKLPSPKSLREGMVDPDAVEEAVAKAVAQASGYCRVNGVWHAECGEPAIINLYSPQGVRRFASEMRHPMDMPHGNHHWTMFPVTDYPGAAAEPEEIEGWHPENVVDEDIRPPQIGLREVIGLDFIERETVRHLRCLPAAIDELQMPDFGNQRRVASKALRAARSAFNEEMAAGGLLNDPGPAVEAARNLVDIVQSGVQSRIWPGLAIYGRTFARWDNRPVALNEIVPQAPRAK